MSELINNRQKRIETLKGLIRQLHQGADEAEVKAKIEQLLPDLDYSELIRGLEEARALGADTVEVFTDSELLARQLQGLYRVHSENLQPLYRRARASLGLFKSARVRHIPRAQNAQADRLARLAATGA